MYSTVTRSRKGSQKVLDESSYDQAVGLAEWKGHVTSIEAKTMTAREVVRSYHDVRHVEQFFRTSKTDLRARPTFHRTKDAIEAHLTILFTTLALVRLLQETPGLSLTKIITPLRPLREFVGEIDGHEFVYPPDIPPEEAELVTNIENYGPGVGTLT